MLAAVKGVIRGNTVVMQTGIHKQVLQEITELAEYHKLSKMVLFGSRARGDYQEKSDIDLAVSGGDIYGFSLDVEEKTEILPQYDVVDMNSIQDVLLESIKRDGVILYEKIR